MVRRKTRYDLVEFLLFNESIPGLDVTESDRINVSNRNLHLWITFGSGQYREDSSDVQ
jgi:hypothetical protein